MGKAIPQQHPAVVLRSRYDRLRTLLVIALIAVVALTTAVLIVASDDGPAAGATGTRQAEPEYGDFRADGRAAGSPRYDGGPEEGSADVTSSQGSPAEPQPDWLHHQWPVRGALMQD